MLKVLQDINRFLALLLSLCLVAVLSAIGWIAGQSYLAPKWALEEAQARLKQREAEVQRLQDDVQTKQRQIDRLDLSLRLLKVDQRVARIEVLSQTGAAKDNSLTTRFTFVELGPDGKPLDAPREFTIQGDLVYVDAQVVKFLDSLIETGDPERTASICIFRRLFGESQQPKQGFPLDAIAAAPTAYRSGRPLSAVEQEIWSRFWEYANDPQLAEKAGVRAAHGEAPSQRLKPGMRYRIEIRSSGGLSIVPEPPKPAEDKAA